jgi:hypothetical protein
MKYLWITASSVVVLSAFVASTEWYVRKQSKAVYGVSYSLWWS